MSPTYTCRPGRNALLGGTEMSNNRLLLIAAILCCYLSRVAAAQCPALTSISPPSGLRDPSFTYVITGTALDQVANVTSSMLTLNYTIVDSTSIRFNFLTTLSNTNNIVITLVPTQSSCNQTSDTIFVLLPAPIISALSSTEGQPGTVIRFTGCFPPACGDNSSSYSITVGGVQVVRLDPSVLSESAFNMFTIRLVEISSEVPQATVRLITQYSTIFTFASHTINYRLAGSIASISPSTGQQGTRVTITGTNLLGYGGASVNLNQVRLGGNQAQIISSSQTQVVVRASSGPVGMGNVQLNSTQTFQSVDLSGPYTFQLGAWTQRDDGQITEVTPPAAQAGSSIYLCGNSIFGGGTSITDITVIGNNVSNFSSSLVSDPIAGAPTECINAIVPPATSGSEVGGVNLTADTGAIILTQSGVTFQYASLNAPSPTQGQVFTEVTITGTEILSGYDSSVTVAVFLSGVQATVINSSPQEVIVTAGAPPSSAVNVKGDIEVMVTVSGLSFSVTRAGAWRYLSAGAITTVSPSYGQRGTRITITGTNLLGYGTQLTGANIIGTGMTSAAASIISFSTSQVILEVPAPVTPGYTGTATIELVANNGARVSGMDAFEYRTEGVITAAQPTSGQNGTFVNITGTNLFGYGTRITSVSLGQTSAKVMHNQTTNTSVYVRAGVFDTTSNVAVPITIISDTFAQVRSTSSIWMYTPPGRITSISPSQGQFGSIITITGTNLRGGGSSINTILMDGIPPNMTISESDTEIRVRLGDDSLRDTTQYPGQVFLQADTGAVVIGSPFSQLAPGRITTISPQQGRTGTEITITGNDLTGFGSSITSVEIAGVSAMPGPYMTTQSDTMLVVQAAFAPNGTSGLIRLTINTGAIIESNQSFTYLQNGSITAVSPGSGAEGGGILITGEYLQLPMTPITSVTIGGSEVTRIVTQSSTVVAVVAGPAPMGGHNNLPIRLTAEDESYIEGSTFSYQNLVVSVSGTSQGQHGTRVTLNVPFPVNEVMTVTIDEQKATIVSRDVGAMTVLVQVPRARQVGQYMADITVESNDHNIARLRNGFTYLTEGHISTVTPDEGQKGTRLTIIGENLYGGGASVSSVTLGGVSGTVSVLQHSQTMLNVSISQNPSPMTTFPLSTTITITANTGAITQRTDAFTYLQPGVISSFSPMSGQRGTRVTISGTSLLQGSLEVSTVRIAGVQAQVTGTPTDTEIQVVASSSTPQSGTIEVTLSSGAIVNSINTFQFNMAGSITSVTPATGTTGTRVTIQGTSLLGGGMSVAMVTLDGTVANVSSATDTTITVVAQQALVTSAPGRVEVISNTGAIVSADAVWSYTQLGSITSVTPTTGQQGVMVTISGVELLGGSGSKVTSVSLAGVPAMVVSSSDTTVVVRAGYSSSAVTGPVQLTINTGVVITSDENIPTHTWTYYAASLNSISQAMGVNGTLVTLTGVNLPGPPNSTYTVDTVTLAGVEATDVRVVSQTSITARAGFSPATSSGNVRITSTSGAYLELSNAWQYGTPGVVNTVTPSIGYPGDTINITGERLVPAGIKTAKVVIGQSEAFSTTVISASELRVIPGPYQELDADNIPLPVLIEASNGATVLSGNFTYNATGTVTGISPMAGGTGSQVTITGTGLLSGGYLPVSVYLAGIQATVLNATDTMIQVEAGMGSDVTGSVVIQSNNSRQTGRASNAWTYLPAVSASMVSPQSGRNGTLVQLDLSDIPDQYNLQSVQLGDIKAAIVSTANKIVTVAAGMSKVPTTGDNIILTYQNSTILTITSAWSYQSPTSITASTSDLTGYYQSMVTLSGTGFQGPAGVDVNTATVAGLNTTILSQTITQLRLQIEENLNSSAGDITGPIILTFDDGAVFDSQGILFTYPQLQVTSVSPSSGQYRTRVTILGTGLLASGSTVTSTGFSNIASYTVTSHNNTEIILSAAAYNMSTAVGDIVYTINTGAQVIIPSSWSYVSPGEITSVDPVSGNRGTVVTITGRNMLAGGALANAVYLNNVLAEEILISSNSLVQVRAGGGPMQSAGNVRIVVNTEAEVTSQANLFSYQTPGSVSSISPSSGQFGTRVDINGQSFDSGEGIRRVTLAGVQASIVSATSTMVSVTVQRPAQLGSFTGSVTIESNRGTITQSTQNFTYLREGFIATLTPSQGQRGTRVTLSGVDMLGGGSVIQSATIAGTPADIVNQSDTEVVLMAGDNAASASAQVLGDVVLVANTGAQVTRVGGWTYVQYGSISSITPSIGQYGTRVTLTGTDLTAGAQSVQQVLVGDVTAYEVISSTATQVVFRAGEPAISNYSNATITLISSNGGNITTDTVWTYQQQGMITSIDPVNGTGAIDITIRGFDLLGGGTNITQITLAGIPAREITFSNDTVVRFAAGFNNGGGELQGDVILESDTGALTTDDNGWTYINECPVGQFGNTNSCMPCDDECVQCNGPTEFDCFDCQNFRILNGTHTECVETCPRLSTTDKQCVESCQSNQFERVDLDNITFCLNCHQQCDPNLGCSGPNNTIAQCTRCRDVEHNGFCISECPIETFNDRGTCTSCHSQCDPMFGCTGPSSADCNQCTNNILPGVRSTSDGTTNSSSLDTCVESCPRLYYNDMKICRPCSPECLDNCTGSLASQCGTCSAGSITYSNNTRLCVPECNPNSAFRRLFQDVTTGACQQCSPFCSLSAGCTGPLPSDCIACRNFTGSNTAESEFTPRYNGECVLRCPDNPENRTYYYADLQTGNCMACSSECSNDCMGPDVSDCINNTGQDPFSAGPGTTALVIIIILFLFVLLIAVSVFLVWKLWGKGGKFVFPQSTSRNLEAGTVELEQHNYTTHLDATVLDNSNVLYHSSEDINTKELESSTIVTLNDQETYTDMEVPSAQPTQEPPQQDEPKEETSTNVEEKPSPPPPEEENYAEMDPQLSPKEVEENYALMETPTEEENYTEMQMNSPTKPPSSEPESAASSPPPQPDPTPAAAPAPPLPPKPSSSSETTEEKPLPKIPPKPPVEEVSPADKATAAGDEEELKRSDSLPETLEGGVSLSQENIYEDTVVMTNPNAELPPSISASPLSEISSPLPPTHPQEEEDNLYDDTENFSPAADSDPLISHIDDVYEDTEDATQAAQEYMKQMQTSSPPPPLPPPPSSGKPPAPPPPRQTIPKRLSNTPLPEIPSSAPTTGDHSNARSRPMSVTSVSEEDTEELYEPIPANSNLLEETKTKKPQPKSRGLRGKLSFGKK